MRNTGPPPRAASMTYLPPLDGLRAVSILLVVVSHLGLDRVLPGAFGVTLFFFISG
jgi:peptidoglycan/LPS O-acetylase OafA/YrhL